MFFVVAIVENVDTNVSEFQLISNVTWWVTNHSVVIVDQREITSFIFPLKDWPTSSIKLQQQISFGCDIPIIFSVSSFLLPRNLEFIVVSQIRSHQVHSHVCSHWTVGSPFSLRAYTTLVYISRRTRSVISIPWASSRANNSSTTTRNAQSLADWVACRLPCQSPIHLQHSAISVDTSQQSLHKEK